MRNRVIAATKLAIPRPARAAAGRASLLARLDQPSYRIAVVAAPAGFGKTVLLATWAIEQAERPAWYSCDVTDGEPVRFWTGLLAALGERWPGVGDDALVALERAGSATHDVAISIANDIGDVGGPATIVIDDLHLAGATPTVLAEMVAAWPPNARLVIGSRRAPPFSLARLRVDGSLLELRSEHLRFSLADTATVLTDNEVEATATELELLHDLTEGWPAGIQLAAMSLQRATVRAEFFDAFASTDRAVTDFLVNEVLDGLPADEVEFLYLTSVFDEFDGPLCEDVTGRTDAGAVIDQLVAAGLFVVSLDDRGQWYRYHHLFGAFLRARLRARGHDRWRSAHDRAGRALEARGDTVAALRHALAIGAHERAASVVRSAIARSMNLADVDLTAAVVRHWLHERGGDLVTTDPDAVLELVLALIVSSGPDDAVRWLHAVEQAHPDPPPELDAYVHGVWAEHHLHRGQADEGLRHAGLAMTAVGGKPPEHKLFPMFHPMYARAHLDAGDVDGARRALDVALECSVGHAAIDDVRLPGMRSWVALLDGELRRAERAGREVLHRADGLGLEAHEPGRMFACLALAGVSAERMDDDDARRWLDDAGRDVDVTRRPPLQSLAVLQRAAFARLTDDEATAEGELARARLLLPSASASVRSAFTIEALRQAIHFRPWAAADLLVDLGDGADTRLLRARVALEDDDQRAAAAELASCRATTTRERVELGVMRALVERDVELANGHLGEALRAAEPERFVRTVIGAGPGVAKLLSSFAPDRRLEGYVAMLIEAAGSVVVPRQLGVGVALVEPLSGRELGVLRYLASRMTNQEIASALYVSVNTLKTHVKSIYRKLAVSTRADAVAAGRRHRLI